MMVKRTNGILVITVIFLLLRHVAFGGDGVDAHTSGVAVAKSVLFGSDSAKEIPESAKSDYLGELAKIENSRFVRVTYSQMSAWRKEQFVQRVNEWIEDFPEQDFRTEVIVKACTAQYLNPIAQLFLVPPTNSDRTVLKKAHTQLVELENIVQDKVKNKVNAFLESLRKQHPVLGEDFVLEIEDQNMRFRCAFQMEDDLNPFQRIPIADADFEKLKMQVSAFMEKGQITLRETQKKNIAKIETIKSNNPEEDRKKARAILQDVFLPFGIQFGLRRHISECRPLIERAYHKVTPGKIEREYRGYAAEIDKLIDSSVIKKASDEIVKIQMQQSQKHLDDHKKKFEMVIASQPKEPVRPKESVYELPNNNHFFRKICVMAVVNGIVLSLIFYFARRQRKSRNTHTKDEN